MICNTITSWDSSISPLQWGVVITASLVAALWDIRCRRIPNWLTGPVLLSGLFWATATGGPGGLLEAVGASLLLALPYVVLFLVAKGGAGDAKLMAAAGAWLGLANGIAALAGVCLFAVLLAIVFSLAKKRAFQLIRNLSLMVCNVFFLILMPANSQTALMPEIEKMQTMPYGLAIFLGMVSAASGMYLWRN